jgi:hypothetical protein
VIAREDAERNPRMARALAQADVEHAAREVRRRGLGLGPALAARLDAELAPKPVPQQPSAPEESVALALRAAGLPFVREHRFHARRWRLDFALLPLDLRVAIEVQGGYRGGTGRHSRGEGFERDCEKFTEAQLAGWIVLLLPSGKVSSMEWMEQVRRAIALRCAVRATTEVP